MPIAEYLLTLEQSLGSMALAAILYGSLLRWKIRKPVLNLMLGALFGCGAILEILDPIQIAPGVIVDMRSLFVGFSGAYVGPVGVAVTLAFTATARLLVGGSGMVAGLISMSIAGLMGLCWSRYVKDRGYPGILSHLFLGLMISSGLVATVLLPAEAFERIWDLPAPLIITFNIFASLVFGAFLEREQMIAAKERHLKAEASLDPLTGLLNRRSFLDAYQLRAQEPPGSGHGLLAVDVDHFKNINDRHGHATGDVVLQLIADTIAGAVREKDLVARFGGEEFIVLLPNASQRDVSAIAERARAAVGALDELPAHLRATISIGAVWSGTWTDLDDTIRRADEALYAAKRSGRNRVTFITLARSAA